MLECKTLNFICVNWPDQATQSELECKLLSRSRICLLLLAISQYCLGTSVFKKKKKKAILGAMKLP